MVNTQWENPTVCLRLVGTVNQTIEKLVKVEGKPPFLYSHIQSTHKSAFLNNHRAVVAQQTRQNLVQDMTRTSCKIASLRLRDIFLSASNLCVGQMSHNELNLRTSVSASLWNTDSKQACICCTQQDKILPLICFHDYQKSVQLNGLKREILQTRM